MKRLILFLFFVLSCSLLPVSFKRFTCGFKLLKMQFDLPFNHQFNVSPILSNEELQTILSQPFNYLNRGAQAYVFESKDKKYVIKFFRHHNSLFSTKKRKTLTHQKILRFCSASILAYTKAHEETGVLFLHLNPTKETLPHLQVTGPLGGHFSLNLNSYRFIIQKKALPFEEALLHAYHSHDTALMAHYIDSFVKLLKSRTEKGLRNTDPSLFRNFGFLNKEAIEIDFGNYQEDPNNKDLYLFTKKFRKWLSKNTPEWVPYLNEQIRINEIK